MLYSAIEKLNVLSSVQQNPSGYILPNRYIIIYAQQQRIASREDLNMLIKAQLSHPAFHLIFRWYDPPEALLKPKPSIPSIMLYIISSAIKTLKDVGGTQAGRQVVFQNSSGTLTQMVLKGDSNRWCNVPETWVPNMVQVGGYKDVIVLADTCSWQLAPGGSPKNAQVNLQKSRKG